eukprot:5253239-Pleurochrysis_carterae.AAC.1
MPATETPTLYGLLTGCVGLPSPGASGDMSTCERARPKTPARRRHEKHEAQPTTHAQMANASAQPRGTRHQ